LPTGMPGAMAWPAMRNPKCCPCWDRLTGSTTFTPVCWIRATPPLVPDPCYPAYVAGVTIAGGRIAPLPLLKENGFLPDLEAIPEETARCAKMIWVNYPNNPTGAEAPADFYPRLIDWAHAHDVWVVSDNPYSEICFGDYCVPTFLQFDGAKEIGVEFNSLSKSYNSCGWRTGMILGNADAISALNKVKSHSDRGMFYPLQVAATAALNGDDSFMSPRNRMLEERRDVVVSGLGDIGIALTPPKATFYIWAEVPTGFESSQAFCQQVLDDIAVWMIPGSMYGQYGEGYFRIALTHPAERLQEAMARLKGFMSKT
jgi:LL-diaminopimelate aminotransferase